MTLLKSAGKAAGKESLRAEATDPGYTHDLQGKRRLFPDRGI